MIMRADTSDDVRRIIDLDHCSSADIINESCSMIAVKINRHVQRLSSRVDGNAI